MFFVFRLLANTLSLISVCLILLEKFWIHNQLASTLTFVLKLFYLFTDKKYLVVSKNKKYLMNALVQTILGTVFLDDKLANLLVV